MDNAATPEERNTAARRLTELNTALGQSQTRVQSAQMQYNQLRDNLGAVSRQAQRTQRDIENLSREEVNRNRINQQQQQDEPDPTPTLEPTPEPTRWQVMQQGFNRLAEAGAVQMVGDAVTDIANCSTAPMLTATRLESRSRIWTAWTLRVSGIRMPSGSSFKGRLYGLRTL